MRIIYLVLIVALPMPLSAIADNSKDTVNCVVRLDRTLEVMERRAPMKDEVATALMWLRMDAAEAIETGDITTCAEKLSVIENILNIASDTS